MPGLPVPLPHTLLPPLFGYCGFFSSFARWLACALLPPFPLSPSFSLLCLDFLTKDCQGFQLIISLSFPPDCTLLPHCCVRRLIRLPCIILGSGLLCLSCFVSRCLNCLAKDVSGFSTLAPSSFVFGLCVLVWCPLFCFVCWSLLVAFCLGGLALGLPSLY